MFSFVFVLAMDKLRKCEGIFLGLVIAIEIASGGVIRVCTVQLDPYRSIPY